MHIHRNSIGVGGAGKGFKGAKRRVGNTFPHLITSRGKEEKNEQPPA